MINQRLWTRKSRDTSGRGTSRSRYVFFCPVSEAGTNLGPIAVSPLLVVVHSGPTACRSSHGVDRAARRPDALAAGETGRADGSPRFWCACRPAPHCCPHPARSNAALVAETGVHGKRDQSKRDGREAWREGGPLTSRRKTGGGEQPPFQEGRCACCTGGGGDGAEHGRPCSLAQLAPQKGRRRANRGSGGPDQQKPGVGRGRSGCGGSVPVEQKPPAGCRAREGGGCAIREAFVAGGTGSSEVPRF